MNFIENLITQFIVNDVKINEMRQNKEITFEQSLAAKRDNAVQFDDILCTVNSIIQSGGAKL